MGYYIFHDKLQREACIHHGECPQCRHGFGCTEAARPTDQKGEWLGPFSSYHSAESAAESTKADVLDCINCIP